MSTTPPADYGKEKASREAAEWVSRLDRGLSPADQDDFFVWLAANPEHAATLEQCRRRWRRLDQLADWRPELGVEPNPDLLAPPKQRLWRRRLIPALLAAACIAFAVTGWHWEESGAEPVEAAAVKVEDRRILPDNSIIKLHDGAAHTLQFTAGERRIRLDRGEAFFIVAKDPARPFVVEAGGVTVRAVGTAFNVRLGSRQLDVLVAHGSVEVAPALELLGDSVGTLTPDPTVLSASQRVSLSLASPGTARSVATLTRREIQQTLAWQHGLMTFQDKPLAEIVEELNRLNDRQLVLKDDALAGMRFSGTIRSDNLDGFVRLLQTSFGAEAAVDVAGDIQLRVGVGALRQ